MLTTRVYLFLSVLITAGYGLQLSNRIIGGQDAPRGEGEYMVSLRYIILENHYCGGAVISDHHVLTAAHCLFLNESTIPLNISKIFIVPGNNKLSMKNIAYYTINKTIIHGRFNATDNDIALIKVNEPFATFMNFFNLSKISLTNKAAINGSNCTIAGWGYNQFETGNLTDHLKIGNVTLLDEATCKRKYAKFNIVLPNNIICAGDNNTDSCQGDSGGPLICNNTVAGIIASGVECANEHHPGIYTDVFKYRNWIQQAIGNDTISSSHQIPTFFPMIPGNALDSWNNNSFRNHSLFNSTWNGTYANGSYSPNGFRPGFPTFFPEGLPIPPNPGRPKKNSANNTILNINLLVVIILFHILHL